MAKTIKRSPLLIGGQTLKKSQLKYFTQMFLQTQHSIKIPFKRNTVPSLLVAKKNVEVCPLYN